MRDLVSVIVPAYNAEKYIMDCLFSVISQTYIYLEIIVIDDGSKDDTSKICEQMRKKDQRIKTLRQKNQGVEAARNKGLEMSSGKYVVFLDSDDMLHPLFLEKTLNRLIKTGADIVGCNFLKIRSDRMKTDSARIFKEDFEDRWQSIPEDKILECFHTIKEANLHTVTCKLIKRDLIREYLFEQGVTLGEDTLFMYELVRKGFCLEFTHAKWYLYRMHAESAVHSWEHMKKHNPYAVYTRIRDEEYRSKRYEYAQMWEGRYLTTLCEKYWLSRKQHQKIVCRNLRREARRAMLYKNFPNSRIMFFLTFYCPPLYDLCAKIINDIRKGKKRC